MIEAQPSHTAHRVALRRAAHQILDHPPVLRDPLAIPILGPETAAALRADPRQFDTGRIAPFMRAFMAVRARFAEEQLAHQRARGVKQYVVLGAGLDTFAYRVPTLDALPLRVWEVDYPATQAWKKEQLRAAGIEIPSSLTFVPVDFERDKLRDELARAGFDEGAGAVFAWLGVTPYLTRPAILDTLRYVARATHAGGGVVFDYGITPERLTAPQRSVFELMSERVRAAGEPWQTFFDPDELAAELHALGFAVAQNVTPAELNARYMAGRDDGLMVGSLAHIIWAGATVYV